MKKFLFAALVFASVFTLGTKTAKADAALDAATNFANLQNNYLNATIDYYRNYEIPVMNQYSAAMSDQISQALAANFQAKTMYSQALARQSVNDFQLSMNYDTAMMNLNTQYQNLMNMSLYNYQNNMNQGYVNYLENVNRAYGFMMGQPLFPQYQ